VHRKCRQNTLAAIGILTLLVVALIPFPTSANTLGDDVLGMFPKDMNEFAYADLKAARKLPWFAKMEQQLLPQNFRQFEGFLRSAGIDPDSQVDEMAWGAMSANAKHPYEIAGVALGEFSPQSTEARFAQQKIPKIEVHGYNLWAFGSGSGPNDIFFFFLDNNTAAFGQRDILEQLINVHYGNADNLLDNSLLYPLIHEANGNGIVWAVLDQANTRLALQQLLPQASQFPQASAILDRIKAMEIHIDVDDGVDANFQAVCSTPNDANQLSAMLQGGLMVRRYQVQQSNPDLAQALSNVTVSPSGDRLNIEAPVSNDQLMALINNRTFASPM
jgi:hypothetical protein